jgi:hypothetical protein
MKNVLLLLLGTVFLTGCMHNYDVTLINGIKITHVTKPKLDKESGLYTFRNIQGKKESINASRVVEIAPHSDKKIKSPPPS